ncbi:DivIVA domain-containing protein [Sorangium sp. So ce131]|uniref:DivIVA domain-containing protein n=1 Tax=Sorangium sp. So ce131 TaxID=3133282 RepID=UPI003F5FFB24
MASEPEGNQSASHGLETLQEMLSARQRELSGQHGTDLHALRTKVWFSVALGILGVGLYAAHFGSWAVFAEVFAAGILVTGAAALVGTLLGFLFGIPRTLVDEGGSRQPRDTQGGAAATPGAVDRVVAVYSPNTNLEQISDWLSKILVGVGLTQLNDIPTALVRFSNWLGSGMPHHPEAGKFALGAIAYASVFGFLYGYIWTRVVLSPMFRRADEQLRKAIVELAIAERSVSKAIAKAAVVERSATETVERAQARAEQVLLEAQQRAEQLEDTLKRMLDRLHEPPERMGYADAIRIAEEYVEREGEPSNFLFWLRYAAAQGQRAIHEPRAYEDAKKSALEAARKVLRHSPEMGRYWLSLLCHPEHPQRTAGAADLQVFFKEPEFVALIGSEPYVPASK